jgi:hypothetical protein
MPTMHTYDGTEVKVNTFTPSTMMVLDSISSTRIVATGGSMSTGTDPPRS